MHPFLLLHKHLKNPPKILKIPWDLSLHVKLWIDGNKCLNCMNPHNERIVPKCMQNMVQSKLVPRVYSAFKMATGCREDPGTRWRNTSRIVEYFITWHDRNSFSLHLTNGFRIKYDIWSQNRWSNVLKRVSIVCNVIKYSTIREVFCSVYQGLLRAQSPSWKRSRPWEWGCSSYGRLDKTLFEFQLIQTLYLHIPLSSQLQLRTLFLLPVGIRLWELRRYSGTSPP